MSTSTKSAPSSRQGASNCCFCCSVFALRRESTSSQLTSTSGVQRSKLTEDYSGSCVCPRPGAAAIAWQQPLCVGPSCGFCKTAAHQPRVAETKYTVPSMSIPPRSDSEVPARFCNHCNSGYTSTPLGYLPTDGARSNRLETSRTQRRRAS